MISLEKLATFSDKAGKIGKKFFKNWQILAINQEKLAKSLEKWQILAINQKKKLQNLVINQEKLANSSDKYGKIGKQFQKFGKCKQ